MNKVGKQKNTLKIILSWNFVTFVYKARLKDWFKFLIWTKDWFKVQALLSLVISSWICVSQEIWKDEIVLLIFLKLINSWNVFRFVTYQKKLKIPKI